MLVQPYLFFDGKCDEALAFYKKALNAEVRMLMRFKDNPDGHCPAGAENMVMHAAVRIGDAEIFLSDGQGGGAPKYDGFALSITVPTVEASQKAFNALAEGGQVQMPLTKTFFSPSFGMLADRFGVHWMIYVLPPGQS